MQPSPRFTSSSISLEDVSIVCAWDSASFHRPGLPRVISARECPDGLKNVYLCGSVKQVRRLRDRFTLLGCFVDSTADADLPNCQVLPELAEGFENALEPLLAAVCSRHVTTIQDMILRNARREPEKLALIYEERQWTYQQLCSAACNLRDQLLEEGLTPSKGPVGVRIDASDYSTICLLALMSGRFTVHTLDRGASSQRYRLKACPSQAIVTMHGQNLEVEVEDLHVFHLDEMKLDWSQPLSNLHVDGDLNDVAFIEYTSGSSGTPKAVATVQWRFAHWVPWHLFHFPPGESRDAYNLFWIWYWQLPLTTGSTCVVWPNWQNQDISQLMKYFRRHRVTRCNCLTPGQLSALLYVEETLPEDLQEIFVGGEALPLSTCQSWIKKWPHVRLVANYATTETASDIAFVSITEKIAGLDMPFAPLCDTIVCWNNRMTIVHEELVISGWNVADGYLPPTQSSAFTRNDDGLTNTYRTGDRAQWKDGYIFILGRLDKVVKIRGFRVDTDGLESLLMKHDEVRDVCVKKFDESLYAVVCARDIEKVKTFAKDNYEHAKLIVWVAVDSLPINKSGKKDIAAIQQMISNLQKEEVITYNSEEEHKVAAAYQEVLGRPVARDMPFMEAGGHSLFAMRIGKLLGISPVELFKYPTIADLAKFLQLESSKDAKQDDTAYPVALQKPPALHGPLAVVGLACRLPNAISVEHFWDSLKAGHLMTTELPAGHLGQIPRKGVVEDLGFDCHFWKCSEQQAGMMDTTQRALLEISYESFYSSGFSGRFEDHFRGLQLPERNVAVIMCGGSLNHWPLQLGMDLEESRTIRPDEYFNLEVGSDKDYLASSIAYHLDLHGTAEVVQTACSSALVAISRAVHLLKSEGHCASALCGGASFSPNAPIMAVDGLIWAPDGVCRPYAEGANGTTNADGGGVVILSRSVAMHGHGAHASILGSATNNDGARKSTFSAPSYEGQMEVLRRAHADAGILSSEVNYVEGHGTGTKLGDPLEVAALTEVLGQEGHVLLGSVKGNVGHLNTAAGVPGFLKTVLVLKHQSMVPSLHALNPSKEVDWNRTCLSLASMTQTFQGSLACVSSFGVGGTNAHVVLKASEGSQTRSNWPFEKVTWKRKPLEVLLSSWSRTKQTHHRPMTAALQAPSGQATSTMEDWFYEETREEVRVSELKPKLAAVLLDGDDSMPEGMPKNSVRTNWQRAVPAGKTSGGFLIFLGTNSGEDVDGDSQELLLINCMTLINQLTQSKTRLEVAFILQNTLRYAGLLGFLRSAMKEHPELRLRLMRREDHAKIMFPASPGEFILTTRGLFAPRLRSRRPPPVVQSFATYDRALVTGGLRGLGLRVAKWLAETGRAKSLVLLGRNQPQGANVEMLETLSRQLPVEVRLGDVSRWEEVEALPTCDLVVHCAGAVKDGVLVKLTKEDLRQVIAPKIRGALNIRKKYPTAKKLAFSSSSGLFGVPGQSTYAAGNTFLDAMMPSIQWGGWGETGMAEDLGIQPLLGEHFLPVSAGLECLGRILDAEEMALPVAILDVYWPVYRQQTTVFAPDDPLLANIEVEIPQSSPDQLKQVWSIGSAGSRYRGNRQSLELCLAQHIISGIPVLPGSALVALALEVASKILQSDTVQLQDVKFLMPLELQSVRQLTLTGSKNSSGGSLRLSSRSGESEADSDAVHCTANFALGELMQRPKTKVEDVSTVEDIYEQFAAAGYFYGPDFQGRNFGLKLDMAFCDMPSSRMRDLALDPAHLDIALQLASLIHPVGMRGAPQSIRRLTAKVGAILMSAEGRLQGDSGEESVDVRIFDKEQVVCNIEGLVLATMHAGVPLKSSREVWQETTTARRSSWRVVGEEVKRLHLPEVVENEDEPHEAVAIAVNGG